jgi:hypothetical protein
LSGPTRNSTRDTLANAWSSISPFSSRLTAPPHAERARKIQPISISERSGAWPWKVGGGMLGPQQRVTGERIQRLAVLGGERAQGQRRPDERRPSLEVHVRPIVTALRADR